MGDDFDNPMVVCGGNFGRAAEVYTWQMRLFTVLLGTLTLASCGAAQSFSLHIETSQSQFQIGEAIGLHVIFEMTHDSGAISPSEPALAQVGWPGWITTLMGHDRSVLGFSRDRFLVTPEAGTRDPWSYRLHEGIAYSGPPGARLLHGKPLVLDIDLNQWVRFERPGHYTVHALSHAMGPQRQDVEVESNQIGIDIVAADPQRQAQELAEDVALLNSTLSRTDSASFESRMKAARRITYLDTPAAVREMVRWLGLADVQTAQIMQDGLRSSQHGAEAVAAMKEFLRTPSEPVTRLFLRMLALDKTIKDPNNALAEVVEQKQGAAKAISLKTLLDNMPAGSVPVMLRSEIAGLFSQLPVSEQTALLNSEWKKIDGPEMIPVLRHIYDTAPQSRYPENPLFASAVERLYELDTSRTRLLLLEEMKRIDPRLPYRTLAMLPDATLPELDAMLLDHLQHNGGRSVEELISRYSTRSILEPVKDVYAKHDAEMRSRVTGNPNIAAPACEPPLVAYFLRVDPAWGEKVFRQSLAERGYTMGRCWIRIISETAVYYSGPAWEKVAIDALQDGGVPVKTDAVRSLARYGSVAAKPAIFDAFRYWHEWWENRGEPNEENRGLEQAFFEATTNPKNWSPDDADLAAAREFCLSAGCKSQVPQHRN
jgi:hypothetical protein